MKIAHESNALSSTLSSTKFLSNNIFIFKLRHILSTINGSIQTGYKFDVVPSVACEKFVIKEQSNQTLFNGKH